MLRPSDVLRGIIFRAVKPAGEDSIGLVLHRQPHLLAPMTAIIWLLAGCVLMVDTAGETAKGGPLMVLLSCGAGSRGEGAMNYRLITLVPIPASPD